METVKDNAHAEELAKAKSQPVYSGPIVDSQSVAEIENEEIRAELAELRAKLAAAEETEAYLRGDRDRLRFELTEVIAKNASATERAEKAERDREELAKHRDDAVDNSNGWRERKNAWKARAEAAEAERDALRVASETHAAEFAYAQKALDEIAEICGDVPPDPGHVVPAVRALVKQNAALRAALGKIAGPPIEPDLDGLIEDATCTYCEQPSLEGCTEDCPRTIAVDALALTPPAAGAAASEREAGLAALVERLRADLETFASNGVVEALGREDFSVMQERIVDWFGPSDFLRAAEVFKLAPPAALDDLRRRERSIGAEEELRRLAELYDTQRLSAVDLLDRADAIAAERKEGE